jgi:MFS family permease
MSQVRWNTVVSLSLTQALFQTATILVATLSGIVGLSLAPDKGLATLPIAMISVGTAGMLIPASILMRKLGQRMAFIIGTSIGIMAGLLAAYGILVQSFAMFVIANMLVGCYQGFAQYYRFAAADAVPEESKGRAISFVLTGGVIAAIAGPNLARFTQHTGSIPFVYSYLSISALSIVALLIISILNLKPKHESVASRQIVPARPLSTIVRQTGVIMALLSSVISYSVMIMVMTAAPIAMPTYGHTHDDSATVIQWHVLGMYVPSFFTGALIDRFGVRNIILAGVAVFGLHLSMALSGTDFMNFVSGLIFLGIGWNFMFIGGSTLLTKTYRPEEKEKLQAFHDFIVFGVITVSSFLAGSIINRSGWMVLNLSVIPLLVVAVAAVLLLKRNRVDDQPKPSEKGLISK